MPNFPKLPRNARRYKRFHARAPISIGLLDGTPLASVEEIHDISEGGLCFSCRDFVRTSMLLMVTVKDKQGTIQLTARVARVLRATFHRGRSEVGVMFLDATKEQRERLKKLPKKGWFG